MAELIIKEHCSLNLLALAFTKICADCTYEQGNIYL